MNTKSKIAISPLKSTPLHVPGQSVDEEINRLWDEEVSPLVAIIIMAILVSAFEWIRYIFDMGPQQIPFTGIAVTIVLYGSYRIARYKKRFAALKLGRDGEREVGQQLEVLLAKGCIVFHDIVGDGFNVDHVVIGPKGIFTIETKAISKRPGDKVVYRDGRLLVGGHTPERDPVEQAHAQARWIKSILQESTGKSFPVKPVILFPGWFVEPVAQADLDKIWILNPKAFPTFVEKTNKDMDDEDVRLAAYHLGRHIRVL